MAYDGEPTLLGMRSVIATFLATPLSLGAGAPLGPEGPIVVITSGISAALGTGGIFRNRRLAPRLSWTSWASNGGSRKRIWD